MKDKKHSYCAKYVEWIDSTMRRQVWWNPGDLIDESKEYTDRFQTVAYLVNQNKMEYIFANSIHFESGKVVGFGQIFSIPKGCVIRMKSVTI